MVADNRGFTVYMQFPHSAFGEQTHLKLNFFFNFIFKRISQKISQHILFFELCVLLEVFKCSVILKWFRLVLKKVC